MPKQRRLSLRQLIWISLGVMTAVFLASTLFSIAARLTVGRAVDELNNRLLTAQNEVSALRQAYLDQETGQRGFVLTGNAGALQQYDTGTAAGDKAMAELRAMLANDPQSVRDIDRVAATANTWRTEIAEPQIASRRGGPIPPRELESLTLRGKERFDEVRDVLGDLRDRITELSREQIERIQAAQRLANIAQITAGCALVIVLGSAIAVFQRQLTRPVYTLVRDVRAVACGDYDQSIHTAGPREIADIAKAVETMRDSLHAYAGHAADTERVEEQARIAADLHDRIIQRVFGLGLALTSAAAQRNPDLQPFIDETDDIIRDLREVIFNLNAAASGPAQPARLRAAIIDILESSVAALGFTPTLHFDGPIDDINLDPALQAEVLAVTRESLSSLARHPHVTSATLYVTATSDKLRIALQHNGAPDVDTVAEWTLLPAEGPPTLINPAR